MKIIYQVAAMNEDGRAVANTTLFSNLTAAEEYSKTLGAWAGGITLIEVFDSVNDMKSNNRQSRKEKALAKLTDEDKLALGLVVPSKVPQR